MLTLLSVVLLVPIGFGVVYLYTLAVASVRPNGRTIGLSHHPTHTFAIVIPAHNEEGVIGSTVSRLLEQDYPKHLFSIFVVADHCTDRTAEVARAAGAFCHERTEGPRGGKGAALSWLFQQIFSSVTLDAVVVFDADTRVDRSFLHKMDARLQEGDRVIQGCHRILNPQDGWFAALTWAMFIVDNRFQNLGRANLGWSAKHMGDSICFRSDIIEQLGWGDGLTEDYEFRQKLLLQRIKIAYEPAAVGYGEAPATWSAARAQRTRWLSGTFRASRQYAWQMLRQGLRHRDATLLDGALQAFLPSYSTLTLLTAGLLLFNLVAASSSLLLAFNYSLLALLAVYPLLGLALERAPLRAYVAIMLGPFFIVWRTVLSLRARFGKQVVWVRTARRSEAPVSAAGK